jgi:Fe-S cluster assembly ATP-binding protein
MFKIKNLSAVYDNQSIVENLSIEVKSNQFHVVLGDEQSGGSALFQLLAGNTAIEPSHGTITFDRYNFDQLSIDQRNRMGIFVISVNRPELDGVDHYNFAKTVFKIHHPNASNNQFEERLRDCYDLLNLPHEYDTQIVNDSNVAEFDLARTELLLMMLIDPRLIIIENIDSELNLEEQEFVAKILSVYIKNQNRACLLFTQNQTFAKMLPATHVSVMAHGTIRKQGSGRLLERIIQDEHS